MLMWSASGIRKVKNTETRNSLANEPLDLTAALMLTGTDTCSLEVSCNKNSPKPGKQLCDSLQLSISMLTWSQHSNVCITASWHLMINKSEQQIQVWTQLWHDTKRVGAVILSSLYRRSKYCYIHKFTQNHLYLISVKCTYADKLLGLSQSDISIWGNEEHISKECNLSFTRR